MKYHGKNVRDDISWKECERKDKIERARWSNQVRVLKTNTEMSINIESDETTAYLKKSIYINGF